jgi:hypothetical protein
MGIDTKMIVITDLDCYTVLGHIQEMIDKKISNYLKENDTNIFRVNKEKRTCSFTRINMNPKNKIFNISFGIDKEFRDIFCVHHTNEEYDFFDKNKNYYYFSLGFWGKSVEIFKEIAKYLIEHDIDNIWIDENDCDDIDYGKIR